MIYYGPFNEDRDRVPVQHLLVYGPMSIRIIQEARSAAKVGNMAGIYQAIRRIPKSGKKRFQQTTKNALGDDYGVIEDALDDWFGFARKAYAATVHKEYRRQRQMCIRDRSLSLLKGP